jgi:hypothetical protein
MKWKKDKAFGDRGVYFHPEAPANRIVPGASARNSSGKQKFSEHGQRKPKQGSPVRLRHPADDASIGVSGSCADHSGPSRLRLGAARQGRCSRTGSARSTDRECSSRRDVAVRRTSAHRERSKRMAFKATKETILRVEVEQTANRGTSYRE